MRDSQLNSPLSYIDRQILESYLTVLDGLAVYLGRGYEIVLHSLEDLDHSAIKVINGFHTGRKEGAPNTDMALSVLEKAQGQPDSNGATAYFATNKNGEPLKSTTIFIRGENKRIIGLLCINCYLNTSIKEFFEGFIDMGDARERDSGGKASRENFSSNSDEVIEQMVLQIREEVMADPTITAVNKNKEIIRRAYQCGVYNLKDAVVQTAELLNISKNTVYLHLRNIHG